MSDDSTISDSITFDPYAVSGYTITDRIGKGGMGEVYKAVHNTTGQTAAVKFAINTRRFKREYTQLKGLDHPRIVKALEYNENAEPPYLVMEYVQGRNLKQVREYIGGPLPVQAIGPVFAQVVAALAYIHENNHSRENRQKAISATASLLATSPDLWPPNPSHTTYRWSGQSALRGSNR